MYAMLNKVKLSNYCIVITVIVLIAFIIGIILSREEEEDFIILLVVLTIIIGVSLFYYPKSIEVNDTYMIIHRQLKDKTFSLQDLSYVDRCYPSPGGLRLCGSGGFFGYWGYFTDIIIGNYFGYYGDRSQSILIKLKDGKNYVVSCERPDEMVAAINEYLK